ncbi:MAG: hypothetical protein P4N59_22385, partial [Negativicutes bacterium]|nr:hypothetical protein [Negativicutes bacterium]
MAHDKGGISRSVLLASASAAALALGVVSPDRAMAQTTTIATPVTGPYNWTTGNLSVSSHGAISGGNIGISASVHSGTLINSGTVTGFTYGILNRVNIDTLLNSGTVSGSGRIVGALTGTGIQNRGNIGTLTNSGTVSGRFYGIWNVNTIGTLINNGTAKGNNAGIANSGNISTLINGGISGGGIANFG